MAGWTLTSRTLHLFVLCLSVVNMTNGGVLLRSRHENSQPRLSEADIAEWTGYNIKEPEGPGTYSFGFDVEDPETGNIQFRSEERHKNGSITGSYGFMTPDRSIHIVHYVADELGYRTTIEEGGRLKPVNGGFSPQSDRRLQSPEMTAALASLRNFRSDNKVLEQRVRPINRPQPPPYSPPKQQLRDDPAADHYYVYYIPISK